MKPKTANIILLTVIGLIILTVIVSSFYWLYINLITRTEDTIALLVVQSFAVFMIYVVFKSDLGNSNVE